MSTTEQTSGTDWKPGDLAVATVRGESNVRVMRTAPGWWLSELLVGGWRAHGPVDVTDLRRLYVLDIEDPYLWGLLDTLRVEGYPFIADQIKAQLSPAVPEPTGLGAVVRAHAEQASVCEWVRVGMSVPSPWRCVKNMGLRVEWSDLIDPDVLSEGWSE